MNKLYVLVFIGFLLLSACSNEEKTLNETQENDELVKVHQESIEKTINLVKQNDWESALEQIKEVPNDFSVDVEPLMKFIEANIAMESNDFSDNYEMSSIGLSYLKDINLENVNSEISAEINRTRDKLQSEVDLVINEAKIEEELIVDQAYDLFENHAVSSDGEEAKRLFKEVQSIIGSYNDFKSDYKVDAHILYLYAEQRLLIEQYWEGFEDDESYGLKFANKHKSSIVKHLTDLDPKNKGVMLPSHVLWNLKGGMKSFFYITEEDWDKIYNGENADWEKFAEEKENSKLRKLNPQIGMTDEEVMKTKWGRPNKINRTTTQNGVREQWVYDGYKYLYFEEGYLTTIQE